MIRRRREVLRGLCAASVAAALGSACGPIGARAEPTRRTYRIGFLSSGASPEDPTNSTPSLSRELRDLGYVEGRDLVIEGRWADGVPDRLPRLAAELVALRVDVLVTTGGSSPAQAARQATTTVPIVFRGLPNPVELALVANLARPGGNVTGVANPGVELAVKRVELLKQTVPGLARVAAFFNPSDAGVLAVLRATEDAARAFGIDARAIAVNSVDQLDAALDAAWLQRPDGLVDLHGGQFYGYRGGQFDIRGLARLGTLLGFAEKHRLPQMYNGVEFAAAGGLMGLGSNSEASWRTVARLVDKILTGAKPSELPVEVNAVFELALNLGMARKIGLTFPESVVREATEVIP